MRHLPGASGIKVSLEGKMIGKSKKKSGEVRCGIMNELYLRKGLVMNRFNMNVFKWSLLAPKKFSF